MPHRSLLRLFCLAAWCLGLVRPVVAAPGARPLAAPSTPGAVAPAPLGCAPTTATFTNVAAAGLPNAGTYTATLTVTGAGPFLWDANLTTNLVHPDSDDLDVTLISPAGTRSTITTDNGNNRSNVFDGTVWDDQASYEVANSFFVSDAPFSPMVPEEALGAFIGENPNGTWQLVLTDDTANAAAGQHDGWSLELTTLPVSPKVTTYEIQDLTDYAIPDSGNLVRTLEVAGAPTTPGQITLSTDISHARNDDIDVLLISPTLITHTITSDNGGTFSGGYNNMQWHDQAGGINPPGPVSDQSFSNGSSSSPMVPEAALAAYNGLNPNGTWKLIVSDDLPINTGTLQGWGLEIKGYDCLVDLNLPAASYAWFVPLDQPLTHQVAVQNLGSTAAQDVVVEVELVPNQGAATPDLEGWDCQGPLPSAGLRFTCSQATLLANGGAGFSLNAHTPAVPMRLTTAITATTVSTDPNPFNNTQYRVQYAVPFSLNGQPWPLADQNVGADDNGAVLNGGQGAVNIWGGLRLRVYDQNLNVLTPNALLTNLDLTYLGGQRWSSLAPVAHSGVAYGRHVWAPAHANWLRYVDVFTNTTSSNRLIHLSWGGDLGYASNTTIAGTSTGDLSVTGADTWVAVIYNTTQNANGPADRPPVGMVVGSSTVDYFMGAYDWAAGPFDTSWTGNGDDDLALVSGYLMPPHSTVAFVQFFYRGLAEATPGPDGCTSNCTTPGAGTQVMAAKSALIALEANPPLCDLPYPILSVVANWPEAQACPRVFVPFIRR